MNILPDLPLVGIMVLTRVQREMVLEAYLPYANELHLQLCAFTPYDLNWQQQQLRALVYSAEKMVETTLPFPQVVYNRLYNIRKKIVQKIEKSIGQNKCFNHINKLDKWEVYGILTKAGFEAYLPYTELLQDTNIVEMLDRYKEVFLKPCYGSLGQNVYKIALDKDRSIKLYSQAAKPKESFNSKTELRARLNTLTVNKEYIVQQAIPMLCLQESIFDIRVLVQKDLHGMWGTASIFSRITSTFFINTSIYAKVESTASLLQRLGINKVKDILAKLQNVSIKAAVQLEKVLGHLAELSVDFALAAHGELKIIEVNGKPEKAIYKKLPPTEEVAAVYRRPLEYALYLTSQNNHQ